MTTSWTEEQGGRVIRAAADWRPGEGAYEDIRYELADGIATITIDRPEVRNAFRPETLIEVSRALESAREDTSVGVIVLTGEGPLAFCSGGDQRVRGDSGYVAGGESVGRFHVTDLHLQMRRTPKPIVAMVAGYAVGGGHVLHVVCDLTIAADNARFGQTGPKVGSFDGGYGASLLAPLPPTCDPGPDDGCAAGTTCAPVCDPQNPTAAGARWPGTSSRTHSPVADWSGQFGRRYVGALTSAPCSAWCPSASTSPARTVPAWPR